jgi:hypothetical protein
MKKKIAPKKLAVSLTTIRTLSTVQLRDAAGGGTIFVSVCPACSDICPVIAKPE